MSQSLARQSQSKRCSSSANNTHYLWVIDGTQQNVRCSTTHHHLLPRLRLIASSCMILLCLWWMSSYTLECPLSSLVSLLLLWCLFGLLVFSRLWPFSTRLVSTVKVSLCCSVPASMLPLFARSLSMALPYL